MKFYEFILNWGLKFSQVWSWSSLTKVAFAQGEYKLPWKSVH